MVIPIKYTDVAPFKDGLAQVKVPPYGKTGYMDKSGNWVIKPIYEVCSQRFFSEGLVGVAENDGSKHYAWKFIDKNGKTVLTLPAGYEIYESYGNTEGGFHDGVAKVTKWGEVYIDGYQFINRDGKLITNELYGIGTRGSKNGLIYVGNRLDYTVPDDYSYRYIDTDGKTVFEGNWLYGH